MIKLLLIGLMFSVINARDINWSVSSEKIVGGDVTTIEKHPWQVILYATLKNGSDYFICGGTILSSKYILTAAHCLDNGGEYRVGLGMTYLQDEGIKISAKPIIHENYDSKHIMSHDVGLLVLDTEVNLDGVKTKAANLPNKDEIPTNGQDVVITGWGDVREDGNVSEQLREVTLPFMSYEKCKETYPQLDLTEDMLCAGLPEGGKDSCQGDSGGPMVISESQTLVGVVSWGHGCARPKEPGVYANVAYFRDWIKTHTGL